MTTTLSRTFLLHLAIGCVLVCACGQVRAQSPGLQVIPAPRQVSPSEGSFVMGRDAHIVLADGKSIDDRFAAKDFADDAKLAAGVNLKIGGGGSRGE